MRDTITPCPERFSKADRITWDLSDPAGEDRRWREKKFKRLPESFQVPVARKYRKLFLSQGRTAANTFLRKTVAELSFANQSLALDNDAATAFAKARAREIESVRGRHGTAEKSYKRACEIVLGHGFEPPPIKNMTTSETALKRMCDSRWWKRRIASHYPARFEAAASRCGMVHKKASLYVSNQSLQAWEARQQRNRFTLQGLALQNEEGSIYSLEELIALSVSNPSNRRNELMARLYGFDQQALEQHDQGIFITITCPSRMHAHLAKSGDPNPKFDGTTPSQAQKYLCQLWARIRANLKHVGIAIYGFRIAEPQHDGTPHWHLLLYVQSQHQEELKAVILRHALADSPDEKGAQEHRCKFEAIDRSKGSGISYIAKYVSKNIDGAHVGTDLHGKDATQSAKRTRAWASIHGIRQFQQFGGPPVTVWRELRKGGASNTATLEAARVAADTGNWKAFTEVLGGTQINRKNQRVSLEKEFSAECGLYGEPKGYLIIGVTDGEDVLLTRVHTWRLIMQRPVAREAATSRPARGRAHLEFCQ